MRERLVLDFHGIGVIPEHVMPDEAPYWCPVDVFEAILDSIPGVERATGVRIELTCDDGNASDARIVLPALADRGMTACFFVCAGRLGMEGFLDAPALAEMRAAGMRIGSHGWAHVDWRHLGDEGLSREVEEARDVIGELVGGPVNEVAIPFGSYDRRVLARVRRAGFTTAYTSDGGRAQSGSWLVPRESYTVAWKTNTLALLAGREVGRLQALRRGMVRQVKRLR